MRVRERERKKTHYGLENMDSRLKHLCLSQGATREPWISTSVCVCVCVGLRGEIGRGGGGVGAGGWGVAGLCDRVSLCINCLN